MTNSKLEILVEEPSMENFLEIVLPQILPENYQLNVNCFIRAHEGKQHLRKELPLKIRAYSRSKFPIKVLVLHDQDSSDCLKLKNELISIIDNYSSVDYKVRIVCRELECWYLGDLMAIELTYNECKVSKLQNKSKFRNPDVLNGTQEMKLLCKRFSKIIASKTIPLHMNLINNKSESLKQFIAGVKELLEK